MLTVDFSGGNPIPAGGLSYGGGTGSDALALTGGSATNMSFVFTNAHDGSVTIDGNAISYTGLEPIASDIQATHVTLDYSTTGETITVQQYGTDTTRTVVTSTCRPRRVRRLPQPDRHADHQRRRHGRRHRERQRLRDQQQRGAGALTITGGTGADDVNFNVGISLSGTNALSITAETIDVGAVTVATADGSQSYSGALSVSGSTLQTTATGSVILGGDVTVSGSAAASIDGKLDLGGATRTFNVTDATGTSATDLDVTAIVSNGGVTKTGNGTMRSGRQQYLHRADHGQCGHAGGRARQRPGHHGCRDDGGRGRLARDR